MYQNWYNGIYFGDFKSQYCILAVAVNDNVFLLLLSLPTVKCEYVSLKHSRICAYVNTFLGDIILTVVY